MKDKLQLLRNQLKMGHRISFSEAMLLQRAIDILVNKAGNSPAQSDCCPAQNQGWIPVSERMPEDEGQYYLTYSEGDGVCRSYFFDGYFADQYITHWMPLPAAPQEVSDA